jgi:metalloendopeptidase OMA1, mitochondrial
VHRVVSRILEANDLGTLRGDLRTPIPARAAMQTGFGFGGRDVEEDSPDLWDPDVTTRRTAPRTGRKEWNLLVVNDGKVVNAMAAPGKSLHSLSNPTPTRA